MRIISLDYHRNGVSGIGFWVVLFQEKRGDDMIASVFPERGCCAVFSVAELAKRNIAFANGNSWRGDDFEPELRKAIDTELRKQGITDDEDFNIKVKGGQK